MNSHDGDAKKLGISHFVVLYGVVALATAGAAVLVQILSASLIRRLHPHFPGFVELGLYTPAEPYIVAHRFGVVGIVIISIVFACGVVYSVHRRMPRVSTALASTHVALLLLLLLGYALSATQLAGVATALLQR
jgi:hypothetical protein